MSHVVRFDCFEVDLDAGQIRKRGIKVRLRDQPFQVLASLLKQAGQVVTRDSLRRSLWPDDVFVDFDNILNTAIARLRTALGDSAKRPRFIETLPKHGYRFIGQVLPSPPMAEVKPSRKPRLLVLPFINLSGDPAQEYFNDAMTDEIITALASLAPEQLAVIARTTAMRYKGSHKDVARIGRDLGVDYIVEGAFHHMEEEVAVNAQLIQTSDEAHLFARRYQAGLHDIFRLHNSIAQDVAAHIPAVAGKVKGEQRERKPTENLAAYNEYIKGRYEMWKWTPEGVAKAKEHLEAALTLDPNFALACDGLANLYGYLGFWGFMPPDDMEPLRRFYGVRAFELDPALAEPCTHIAYHPQKIHYEDAYSYNWLEAEREMARARGLNPNSPLIRVRYASVLMTLGHTEHAVKELECALELNPLSMEIRIWMVLALFFGRQSERALAQAQQLLKLEPGHHVCYMMLGLVYLGMQRYEESAAAFRRAAELSGDFPLMLGWLGLALGLDGQTHETRMLLQHLHAIAAERFVLPSSFAWLHLALGEIDEAFVWMERAAVHNDEWIHPLKTYSFMDPIRSDPRFHKLLCKLNLNS